MMYGLLGLAVYGRPDCFITEEAEFLCNKKALLKETLSFPGRCAGLIYRPGVNKYT